MSLFSHPLFQKGFKNVLEATPPKEASSLTWEGIFSPFDHYNYVSVENLSLKLWKPPKNKWIYFSINYHSLGYDISGLNLPRDRSKTWFVLFILATRKEWIYYMDNKEHTEFVYNYVQKNYVECIEPVDTR